MICQPPMLSTSKPIIASNQVPSNRDSHCRGKIDDRQTAPTVACHAQRRQHQGARSRLHLQCTTTHHTDSTRTAAEKSRPSNILDQFGTQEGVADVVHALFKRCLNVGSSCRSSHEVNGQVLHHPWAPAQIQTPPTISSKHPVTTRNYQQLTRHHKEVPTNVHQEAPPIASKDPSTATYAC